MGEQRNRFSGGLPEPEGSGEAAAAAARAMASAGPGQMASDERRAPVTWRHELQWQQEPLRGKAEGGRGGVVKEWALQRQRAVRVVLDMLPAVVFVVVCVAVVNWGCFGGTTR